MSINPKSHEVHKRADDEDALENKFLSFFVNSEEYGVDILRVREIIGIIDITPLPQTPDFIKGVINLRGKIIPVIELRAKFSMSNKAYDDETCIIVVDVTDQANDEPFQMGVVVDSVSEVLDIPKYNIEPAPNFGCNLNNDFILGMGKIKFGDNEKVIILLEVDKVMTQSDMTSLSSVDDQAAPAEANPDSRVPSQNVSDETTTPTNIAA